MWNSREETERFEQSQSLLPSEIARPQLTDLKMETHINPISSPLYNCCADDNLHQSSTETNMRPAFTSL